jgi:hypothetical protein
MKEIIVSRQRCFHHYQREAVARCPECNRFYCRECVTEHEDRLLCASCLAKLSQPEIRERRSFRTVAIFFQSLAGLVVLWIVFYYVAQILLTIPSPVHEGTTWADFVK